MLRWNGVRAYVRTPTELAPRPRSKSGDWMRTSPRLIIWPVNHQTGEASAGDQAQTLDALVDRMLELGPRLQHALDLTIPEAVSRQLGSVTMHQLEALACLPPEGTTMRQFAEAVGISGAAATALANRMIRQGLAERRDDPNDRRTVWLAPTIQAVHTLEAFRTWQRNSLSALVERFDASQLATFLEVLGILTDQSAGPHGATVGDPPQD